MVNAQNAIELRGAEVEMDQGTSLGISRGIAPGERVVVNPGKRLQAGMKVSVITPVKDA